MSSNPTRLGQTLILTVLVGWIGMSASAAAGADPTAFIRSTGETQEYTAVDARLTVDLSSTDPYQKLGVIYPSRDVPFEYLCEQRADGEIRCTRVTDVIAQLDSAAAERTLEQLGDLQKLFDLDDVVAIRCETPLGNEPDGSTGPTTAADALSTWTSIFGTESDFRIDGSISEEMSGAITGACNAIFSDGSSSSGGSGGTGGLGDVDGIPGMDFCGFEIGDAPDGEIAAMAVELIDDMLEGCEQTLESTIMDGEDTEPPCSNEIESIVDLGDGTEEVCTGCGACWVRAKDGGPACIPEPGETICTTQNDDGTTTSCDDNWNCAVDPEPTGNCEDGEDCIIDNGDGTVSVCPDDPARGCYVRYRVPGEQVHHAPEDGYVVADAERTDTGDIVIETVSIGDSSGIQTTISGTSSIVDDERRSTFCFDATDGETCAPCRGPRCRGLRAMNGQDCIDEICQTCRTIAEDHPKIMAECRGESGDIEICKHFVESAECCADVTGYDVDPRVVRTDPDADYVCLNGEAELAQQQCEEQCWIAGDDCQIRCTNEYERFLGLMDFDPLEAACWEMIWEGCFIDVPETDVPDGGGVPTPFDAPLSQDMESGTILTDPGLDSGATTLLQAPSVTQPTGAAVTQDPATATVTRSPATVKLSPLLSPTSSVSGGVTGTTYETLR